MNAPRCWPGFVLRRGRPALRGQRYEAIAKRHREAWDVGVYRMQMKGEQIVGRKAVDGWVWRAGKEGPTEAGTMDEGGTLQSEEVHEMARVSMDTAVAALQENYAKLTPTPLENPRDHNFSVAMLGIAEGIRDLQRQVAELTKEVKGR